MAFERKKVQVSHYNASGNVLSHICNSKKSFKHSAAVALMLHCTMPLKSSSTVAHYHALPWKLGSAPERVGDSSLNSVTVKSPSKAMWQTSHK